MSASNHFLKNLVWGAVFFAVVWLLVDRPEFLAGVLAAGAKWLSSLK